MVLDSPGTISDYSPGYLSLAWSPDAASLAIGAGFCGDKVSVRDAKTLKPSHELERPKDLPSDGGIVAIGYSPDGKTLAIATNLGSVYLVDPRSGEPRQVLPGNRLLVRAPEFAGTMCSLDYRQNLMPRFLSEASQTVLISAQGHLRGPPAAVEQLVYVVQAEQGQETVSVAEFAKRFGWKNDPARVRLERELPTAAPR